MSSRKWIRVIDQLPPQETEVETKVDDHMGVRKECVMLMIGKLWYLKDESMYTYYTPTHWRYVYKEEVKQ